MSRTEQIADGVTMHLADCRVLLPSLPRGAAILSDPPYGIGFIHGAENIANATKFAGVPVFGDDEDFDPTPWLDFHTTVLWGANHYAKRLPGEGRWLVWDKRAGGAGYGKAMSDVEFAWVSGPRKADRLFAHLWDGFNRASERGVARVHPTQKPVALFEWCLGFVPEGLEIIDPYCGAGASGIAAVKAGRKFTGIEIDPGYFEIAVSRIRAALNEPDMFVETPAPAAQQLSILDGAA